MSQLALLIVRWNLIQELQCVQRQSVKETRTCPFYSHTQSTLGSLGQNSVSIYKTSLNGWPKMDWKCVKRHTKARRTLEFLWHTSNHALGLPGRMLVAGINPHINYKPSQWRPGACGGGFTPPPPPPHFLRIIKSYWEKVFSAPPTPHPTESPVNPPSFKVALRSPRPKEKASQMLVVCML